MTRGARAPRRRRWPRRLALALGATLVALLLAAVVGEIYLRATTVSMFAAVENLRGLYELDERGWPAPVTDRTVEIRIDGHRTTAHLNELGLRGAAVPDRTPGQRRLLVLGDSMVFGYGVDDAETFTARLEPRLREELGVPVVARSGGAPDFGTVDQVHVLRHAGPAYGADLVVLAVFLGNDFADNYVEHRTVVDGYLLSGPMAAIAAQSLRTRLALRFRLWFQLENWLRTNGSSLAIDVPPPPPSAFALLPVDKHMALFLDAIDETEPLRAIVTHTLEAIDDVVAAAWPARLAVVLLPAPAHCDPELWAKELRQHGLDPAAHRFGALRARMLERLAERGVDATDVTPAFVERNGEGLYLDGDFHFSAAGHRVIAETLEPWVAERLRG